MLVLWILLLGNAGDTATEELPRSSGEIRLRQYGNYHLYRLRILTPGFNLAAGRSDPAGPDLRPHVSSPTGYLNLEALQEAKPYEYTIPGPDGRASITVSGSGRDKGFAGEVKVSFNEMQASASVEIDVCTCNLGEVHFIEVRRLDRTRPSTEYYVFHEHSAAHAALAPSGSTSPAWQANFRAALRKRKEIGQPLPVFYGIYSNDTCVTPRTITARFTGDGAVRISVDQATDEGRNRMIDKVPALQAFESWILAAPAVAGSP